MTENIISELRLSCAGLKNAIIKGVTVDKSKKLVTVSLVTDVAFTRADRTEALLTLKKYVPQYFNTAVEISKLTPDCDMVRRKIAEAVKLISKAVSAAVSEEDISAEKCEDGFKYTIAAPKALAPADLCERVDKYLKSNFCGNFYGSLSSSAKNIQDLEVEETFDEPEFEMPVRTFEISDFSFLEGDKIQKTAVYLSDLNLVRDGVVLCGEIEDVRERSYTNKNGVEKVYYVIQLNDGTASQTVTYFARLKTIDKIKALKVGDSIVCTGVNEEFRGSLRFTAKTIDFGKIPEGFVPQKRKSKPVPRYYKCVRPEPFTDLEQTDLFTQKTVPECLIGKSFVVFDLETTGLNSSPVSGNMDKIIEIGAFKVVDGVISESFTTFVNPQKKLSDEITALTGITDEMVENAPSCAEVVPDFFKFCDGSVLVGHNAASFDFKFVDHYCSVEGYILDRKIIDTYPLSQELLFLNNYKLNTVAEKFNITFNHHRAIDDALATAKIFIELIRIKKSLPKY